MTKTRTRCDECNRTPQRGKTVCFYCDPDVSDEAKQEARRKGGRGSRRIEPWLDPDEIAAVEIETVADLKRLLNSTLRWLLSDRVTPAQSRAIVGIGAALRDTLELELLRDLRDVARDMGVELDEDVWDGLPLSDWLKG